MLLYALLESIHGYKLLYTHYYICRKQVGHWPAVRKGIILDFLFVVCSFLYFVWSVVLLHAVLYVGIYTLHESDIQLAILKLCLYIESKLDIAIRTV